MDFIAMPCNSAHEYYDDLASSIKVPLLNIISETLSLLNDSVRTTLLGTQGTMDSGLYQSGFERSNLEFYFNDEWQSTVNQLISLIKSGGVEKGANLQWRELLSVHRIGLFWELIPLNQSYSVFVLHYAMFCIVIATQ